MWLWRFTRYEAYIPIYIILVVSLDSRPRHTVIMPLTSFKDKSHRVQVLELQLPLVGWSDKGQRQEMMMEASKRYKIATTYAVTVTYITY